MSSVISLPSSGQRPSTSYSSHNVDDLISELAQIRQKADRLAQINQLHGRLAGATDLSSIIEAFSVWLTPVVEHDLLAYDNRIKGRSHLYCSCHGPQRKAVMTLAKQSINDCNINSRTRLTNLGSYYIHSWQLPFYNGTGTLLLLRKNRALSHDQQQLIVEAIAVLNEPLRRALEFEDLYEQACKDSLTGLANRRVFETRINAMMERARRYGRPISLASMDLDRFKQINDCLGHAEGDRVLQRVAAVMAKTVRGSDLLVRMGGDEFTLVLPDTDLSSAKNLAERLCSAVSALNIQTPMGDRLGISIGLSQWTPDMSKEEWLHTTDEILYHAKAGGRSKVCALLQDQGSSLAVN